MKILVVSNNYPSYNNPAHSIFTHSQVKSLQTQGVDTAVLSVNTGLPHYEKIGFSQDIYEGVIVYRILFPFKDIFNMKSFFINNVVLYAFKKILKSFGTPDIIHAHFGLIASWVQKVKKEYNIPLVLTEHFSKVLRENRTQKIEIYSKKAYGISDMLIAVGNTLKDSMSDLTNKDITVIPNVLPSHFYYKNIQKSASFTFISIGNLIHSKRFDITINAFVKVNKKYPDTRLKIIGGGELKDTLIKLVKENNIADKVEFSGFLQNNRLPDIYNNCHCFVLPSMFETFGVVYAEALACGLPVIATKCGGPEDFVNEKNGLLIPTDDLDATVRAMEYMYENAENYVGEDISKNILYKLNECHIGKLLMDTYGDLLKG